MVNDKLAWVLSVCAMCAGCASAPSDGDSLPPSSYKVTARVVDSAQDPVGVPANPASSPGSRSAPSDVPPRPSPAAPAPEAFKVEHYSVEDSSTTPSQNFESPHATEPPVNPEEQFLMRVASERPAVPLDGSVSGEAVLANFVNGDTRCSRLAISYLARRVSEIWRVCADREFTLERKAEPTPAVPDDPGLEPSRLMAVHSAYNGGRATVPYGPLTISAQSGGLPDARGCMLIRSALSWQGIPMAITDETICLPPGE